MDQAMRAAVDQRIMEVITSEDFRRRVEEVVTASVQGVPANMGFKKAVIAETAVGIGQILNNDVQFIGSLVSQMEPSFSTRLEERLAQAGKAADQIFQEMQNRIANVEQQLTKTQEVANDVLKRLEKGGEGLDQRHQKVEEAINTLNGKVDGMKNIVDGTRHAMSSELDKTKEDLRKFAMDVRAAVSTGSSTSVW